MTDSARKDALTYIANHYGFFNQRDMLVEKSAELIQSVSKCKRNLPGAYDRFLGELADEYIMIQQMMIFLGEDKINAIVDDKIQRQLMRIRSEDND